MNGWLEIDKEIVNENLKTNLLCYNGRIKCVEKQIKSVLLQGTFCAWNCSLGNLVIYVVDGITEYGTVRDVYDNYAYYDILLQRILYLYFMGGHMLLL